MIYLIRQGETDWNRLKKFNGITEIPLNQAGILQATKQAQSLESIHFDHCFCSTQKRAIQTGEIIYNRKLELDERLIEINCGDFEGTEENLESMKLFWQAVMIGDKGTENFKDFLDRNIHFCEMLTNNYQGQNILIITHAANARVIDYYFKGRPKNYDFKKAVGHNGEIVTYENL